VRTLRTAVLAALMVLAVIVLMGVGGERQIGPWGPVLSLPETTTPVTLADHALLYTTSSKELRYVDGDGNDHELGAIGDISRAEMYVYENAVTTAIDTASIWHPLQLAGFTVGQLAGWTFDVGAIRAIASVATDGGDALFTTSVAHGFTVDDPVGIVGTTNYNGLATVTATPGATTFKQGSAFAFDEAATPSFRVG